MKILQFKAYNHRSFGGELFLDLTRPQLKTNLPPVGKTWNESICPTAAIYGGNASGKSNVLDALKYFKDAIEFSASSWLIESEIPRHPFALSEKSLSDECTYALDFLLPDDALTDSESSDLHRFHYEFTFSTNRVEHEALWVYRSPRATKILERNSSKPGRNVRPASGAGVPFSISPKELALSRSLNLAPSALSRIAQAIIDGINIVTTNREVMIDRLNGFVRGAVDQQRKLSELLTLSRVADVGITGVKVDEYVPDETSDVDEPFRLSVSLNKDTWEVEQRMSEIPSQPLAGFVKRRLNFKHGYSDGSYLDLEDESLGTLTWLTIGLEILDALSSGSLLVVDELDSSLHPLLVAEIVKAFNDPETNINGAQLIFTTHDSYLLYQAKSLGLEAGQVWFVEKKNDGISELFSLSDFSNIRAGSNLGKQYLEGRFGATPYLVPGFLGSLVAERQSS